MKKMLLILAATSVCVAAAAQHTNIPRTDLSPEVGGRISVELDKKLARGWHLYLSEQVRFDDNFTDFQRFHTTVGMSYKFAKHLKGAVEYSFINNYKSSSKTFNNNHRLSLSLTEPFSFGSWDLSIKETFRVTHKSYTHNLYQSPNNPMNAKLKVLLKYKGLRAFVPYAGMEGRMLLNGASCSATYNSVAGTWSDYSFTGYKDVYLNRIRGIVGAEWKLDHNNSLDFKVLLDYCIDNAIDTNAEGTKLKSMVVERQFFPQLCVGYKFSF